MAGPGAILITQCLQNDFVRPIGARDPLPNQLHVGFSEARRLMGENPPEGPVARMMEWAYSRPPGALRLIHIRDSHSAENAAEAQHLAQFGRHCLTGSAGAEPAFTVPESHGADAAEVLSPGLNDFEGTALAELLSPCAEAPLPVGIMGVWTEAKVLFLCYELITRWPSARVAVCSALCAGSSRSAHFLGLDQLRRILGVRVCDSVGEFTEFLSGVPAPRQAPRFKAEISLEAGAVLPDEDRGLLGYLFRHCRSVSARVLDGGFSGNAVLGTRSVDLDGHEEAPHVVKIGERGAIARERAAFERIEEVLGNTAPRVSDFADFGGRGAIKYRYASMSGRSASTFQKRYMAGLPADKVREVLNAVFIDQLGRLYAAATLESVNLFEYYAFSPRWAPDVRRRAEALAPGAGPEFYNPALFYEKTLLRLDPLRRDAVYMAYVHGDLNGANIVIDSRDNVWLIDFFHTHRGHVLRDLIKLENDLLYIFTPIESAGDLEQAMLLSDLLTGMSDLTAPLPPWPGGPALLRAYQTVGVLRGFYPALLQSEGGALQWLTGALRYAVHTLSFDESSELQKKWALYTAARCARRLSEMLGV